MRAAALLGAPLTQAFLGAVAVSRADGARAIFARCCRSSPANLGTNCASPSCAACSAARCAGAARSANGTLRTARCGRPQSLGWHVERRRVRGAAIHLDRRPPSALPQTIRCTLRDHGAPDGRASDASGSRTFVLRQVFVDRRRDADGATHAIADLVLAAPRAIESGASKSATSPRRRGRN